MFFVFVLQIYTFVLPKYKKYIRGLLILVDKFDKFVFSIIIEKHIFDIELEIKLFIFLEFNIINKLYKKVYKLFFYFYLGGHYNWLELVNINTMVVIMIKV